MFEDVDPELSRAVVDLMPAERVPTFKYIIAAGLVVARYLHRNALEETPEGMKFSRFRRIPGGVTGHFTSKLLQVGETLFLLRNVTGFDELCRRLKLGDLDAQFFELLSARKFLEGGFSISVRPHTQVRRRDFDFHAVRGAESVNVEATRIGVPTFSQSTLTNRLNSKHRQLPDDCPGVIFCEYPETWHSQIWPFELTIAEIVNEFFKRKRRVNVVSFYCQEFREFEPRTNTTLLLASGFSVFNRQPKIDFVDWSFLLKRMPYDIDWSDPVGTRLQLHQSEFFRWVDSLVPGE